MLSFLKLLGTGFCGSLLFSLVTEQKEVAKCYTSWELREMEKEKRRREAAGEIDISAYDEEKIIESEDELMAKRLNPTRQYKNEVFSARFKPYQLGEIIPITHDTALFRFLLPHPDDEFNLRPCSTLQACYKYGVQAADQCQRFYTPVTANRTKGYFDLIVKRKSNGKMTSHLFGMHVGDKLLFRSIGLKVQYRPNRWKHVGMIAGGTGFTPMLQVIRHALTEPLEPNIIDKTKLYFLFCNRTEKHILLKGVFDDLAKRFPDRFQVHYLIDQAVDKENWKGWTGYVNREHIMKSMPPPTADNYIIMICGPDQLLAHVAGTPMGSMAVMSAGMNQQPIAADANNLVSLGGVLGDLGYDNNCVYRF